MRRVVVALAAVCFACGSSPGSPSADVTSAGPTTFAGVEAIALINAPGFFSRPDGSYGNSRVVFVTISEQAGACGRFAAWSTKASAKTLYLSVGRGTPAEIAPGSYAVGDGSGPVLDDPQVVATVWARELDGSCSVKAQSLAVSGTVTLSVITSSGVDGSVDVTLEDGTRMTGTFNATSCENANLDVVLWNVTCVP